MEFFFFAILIAAVALLFAIMSCFFKYVDHKSKIEENHSSDRDETSSLLPSETKTETIDNGELDLSKEKSELDLNKEKSESNEIQSESGL